MYAAIAANRRRSIGLILAGFVLLAVVMAAVGLVLGVNMSLVALVAVPVELGGTWAAWYHSDRLALMATGATQITASQAPQLYNLVENMALSSGLPMPKIAIVHDEAPNAFATGRDPQHATIAVTTGLLAIMQRDELQGVIAHEMAHIVNQDTRTMALVVTICGSVALVCDLASRMLFWGGSRRSSDNNPVVLVVGIVAIVLAPLAALLIQAATSRSREALADSTAVKLTRNPTGLRKALEKLDANSSVVRQTSRATAHLWIESPLDRRDATNRMFDTHPPLSQRIASLRRMEGAPVEAPPAAIPAAAPAPVPAPTGAPAPLGSPGTVPIPGLPFPVPIPGLPFPVPIPPPAPATADAASHGWTQVPAQSGSVARDVLPR
ncbi:MAG: heat shock protein HtpX [Frankiaceae bacterium]|jgi:heat shock protein HtpX|nr:heat shock protein HtpX [Frankiaceae bacterium]